MKIKKWKGSVEPIGIESRWGPPALDQMPENPLDFVGVFDYRDDLHLNPALQTDKRIDLLDFREKPVPGAFARIGFNFSIAKRFALDNSGTTLGLVLISAIYTRQDDTNLRVYFDSTTSRLKDPIDPEYIWQFLTSMGVKPVSEDLFNTSIQEALRLLARIWIQAFKGQLKSRITEEFKYIQCPILLIWGDNDNRSLEKDQIALLKKIQWS